MVIGKLLVNTNVQFSKITANSGVLEGNFADFDKPL